MSEKQKILIIDDDEDFRISIRTLLESHNYAVSEAESGKQGLQKVKEENPDLIVLDIMMETIDEGYLLNQLIKFQKEYEQFKKYYQETIQKNKVIRSDFSVFDIFYTEV